MALRVLIVDDHADFRAAASALLAADGLDVIGTAYDGPSALREVRLLQPDLVVLDIQLPGADGFAVAAELGRLAQPPEVVLISSRERSIYAARLSETRALGFLPKRLLSGAALTALVG